MKTGWIELQGIWYYLEDSGAMVCGTTRVIDGTEYTFDDNGAMVEGPASHRRRGAGTE